MAKWHCECFSGPVVKQARNKLEAIFDAFQETIKVNNNFFSHGLSDVQTLDIGLGTKIWQFCVILEGAKIGSNVNICSHCFIESDVVVGDNVTIKNGVSLYNGVTLEGDVFIGPNVTFTNDKNPRSKEYPSEFPRTTIKKGASIGGGAVILPGLTIGKYAMIGAGAIVTKDVPAYSVVYGEAARFRRIIEK